MTVLCPRVYVPAQLVPASPQHETAAHALAHAHMAGYYQQQGWLWPHGLFRATWQRWQHWVIQDEHDRLLGFCSVERISQHLYLRNLHVAAASRGRGHGRQLLERTLQHARQHGCHSVRLKVFAANRLACQWYLDRQFVALEPDGPMIRMELTL